MDSFKEIALSDGDIERMSGAKVMLYKELLDYESMDKMLEDNNGKCVILYVSKDDPNFGHWTAIHKTVDKNGDCVEWWDSYGYKPDEELEFSSKCPRDAQVFKYLSLLLLTTKLPITYNEIKFQKKGDNINTCGWHVCARLNNNDMTLYDYKKMLREIINDNKEVKDYDDAVIALELGNYLNI